MVTELNKDTDLVSTADQHPAASLLSTATKWAQSELSLG